MGEEEREGGREGQQSEEGREEGAGEGGRGAFPAFALSIPTSSTSALSPASTQTLRFLPRDAQRFTLNYFRKSWKVEEEELMFS